MSEGWSTGADGIDPISAIIVLVMQGVKVVPDGTTELADAVLRRMVAMNPGTQPTPTQISEVAQELLLLAFDIAQSCLPRIELMAVIATTTRYLQEVVTERPPEGEPH